MIRRPLISTRTEPLLPSTPLFRSLLSGVRVMAGVRVMSGVRGTGRDGCGLGPGLPVSRVIVSRVFAGDGVLGFGHRVAQVVGHRLAGAVVEIGRAHV